MRGEQRLLHGAVFHHKRNVSFLRRLLSAKKYLHVVLFEDTVRSQQGHCLRASLRDEHAVEWVPMVPRQFAGSQGMEMGDVQRAKS